MTDRWKEYVMEAALLGLFMVSACGFATLLEHPSSPVREFIENGHVRRLLMGGAMGLTAMGLIYSPFGKQSGAHMNPATTLTFLQMGTIQKKDAFFYIVFQFLGGLAGVFISSLVLRELLSHPSINYVATVPGMKGATVAFLAEAFIAFLTMMVVCIFIHNKKIETRTGLAVGFLIVGYIFFVAPLSGFSMNPARTLGSAVPSQVWTAIWIYFTAPILGMSAAYHVFRIAQKKPLTACAKLHHANKYRCIHCGKK